MDWQALQDGLKAWIAQATGVAAVTVMWEGEAEGHRGYPQLNLALIEQDGEGMDELRLEPTAEEVEQLLANDTSAPLTDDATGSNLLYALPSLVPVVIGQRRMQLVITYKSRDARPLHRAYAVLEAVRTQIELPATQDGFDALGITVRDARVTRRATESSEMRDLSVAALTLDLAYVHELRDEAHTITPVERVALGGTVQAGTTSIVVPDITLPPNP